MKNLLLSSFVVLVTGLICAFGQSVKVLSPNGGEKWHYLDNTKAISWESAGVSSVQIDYSLNDGRDWTILKQNVASVNGVNSLTTAFWNPSNTITDHYRIRVRSMAPGQVGDESDKSFIVCSCPAPDLKTAFTQSRGPLFPYPELPAVSFSTGAVQDMIAFNGLLAFVGRTSLRGKELYFYDGVNPPVIPANAESRDVDLEDIDQLFAFNGQLYFAAKNSRNDAGVELWRYTPAQNLVGQVADIAPGVASSSPKNFAIYNNKLYFAADDGVHGEELWVYDGSSPPQMVADLVAGDEPSVPEELTVFKGKLYFTSIKAGEGKQLWVYNGTTAVHLNGVEEPESLYAFKNHLYFNALAPGSTTQRDLWFYDGGEVFPSLEVFYLNEVAQGAFPKEFIAYKDAMYFQATEGTGQSHLWKLEEHSNGSITAQRALDLSDDQVFSPEHFVHFNDKLYFRATNSLDPDGPGEELWSFDGNTTTLVYDLMVNRGSFPIHLTPVGTKLYFRAQGNIGTFWVFGTGLDVLSPNGGENWARQSRQTIQWKALGVEKVHLEYSINGGTDWERIASDYATGVNNKISYEWVLPNFTTDNALVRVLNAADNTLLDVSNEAFRITNVTSSEDELATGTGIKVYPNPSQGSVNIALSGWKSAEMVVHSSMGSVVYQKNLKTSGEVNLSHLAKGTYVVRLLNEDGKQHVSKLVLQ